MWMWSFLDKTDKHTNRIGSWAAVIGVLTAIFTWISTQLQALRPYGWPEAFFVGLGVTILLIFSVTASLALWRYFKPLPTMTQPATNAVSSGAPPILRSDLDQSAAETIASLTKNLSRMRTDLEKEVKLLESRLLEQFHALERAANAERDKVHQDLLNSENAWLGQIGRIRDEVSALKDPANATVGSPGTELEFAL